MKYWLNNYVNQEWKDKYIRSFVSLAGNNFKIIKTILIIYFKIMIQKIKAAWAGSTKTYIAMASGYNLGIPFVNPLSARQIQRASSANVFLLPSSKFWSPDDIIMSRPSRNYTVNDYQQFFQDIGYEIGYEIHKDTKDLIYDLNPPNVEIHCLYGYNVSTGDRYIYDNDKTFPDVQPKIIYGNGDGTVNYKSLIAYKTWIGKQSQDIKYEEYNGVEHTDLLKYQPAIDYILNLLKN